MIEFDVRNTDGRRLHVYDSGPPQATGVAYWQHGGGMSGLPPTPLVAAAADLGLRIVGHDRPGYGSSTGNPGRTVADVVVDVLAVLDHLGIESACLLGLSAGAAHALAPAALAPARVSAVAILGGPAPFGTAGLDWFAGMSDANRAEFEAALSGPDALREHLSAANAFDPSMFIAEDLAAMRGPYWDWQLTAAGGAGTGAGVIEDELACVGDWGFGLADVLAPTLILHGLADTFVPVAHARRLSEAIPASTLRTEPGGHLSTIPLCREALDWLAPYAFHS